MISGQTFTLEDKPDMQFRVASCSPVELLALNAQADFNTFAPTLEIFRYALEHIETEINGKWVPVKAKGRDVYMPIGIEDDLALLNALALWFVTNVLTKVFQGSRG